MSIILAIDDKEDNLIVISALLKNRIPDCNVITAQSGSEGLKKAKAESPDTILLDIKMPGMNGYEVCKRLKENESTRHIPVIMFTAERIESRDRVSGLEAGADAYLAKPVDESELIAHVNAALRIKRAEDALRKEKDSLEEIVRERTRELRESEERYSSLINDAIDSLQSGIIILDKDFKIDWMNRTICEFFGIKREKLIGADKRKAIRERIKYIFDTPDLFENRVLKTYKDNTYTENFECHVLPGDRREERFLVHWSMPILSGALKGGRVEHYYDITEIRRIRDQLLMAGKMEAVGTLAGGIAHDFNNLLQAIMGYTQMLLMDKERDNPDFDKLTQIESSAQRASELTQQLLTFSRKVESKLRPVNINQEIKQVEKLLKRTIPRMIDIELHLEENIKVINADPAQLEQVLMNLGVNARDAMPDGGKFVVETENVILDEEYCKTHLGAVPGEHVLLSFSDTGCGMDKETVEHIFEPFYTTKETGKGTGLGLAMVYGIVKSHDGYIMCYSEPGKGTTFKIYFPAIEESVVSGGLSVDREKEMQGGNETILLVDDEKAILDMGKNMLERFGYTVIKAESGEKAIEIYKAQKERIDLVILDLGMPGMGGHKCLKELLKIDSRIKVIIASGYSEIGKVKETVESGASGFIGKPYQLADMLKKVREALGD